LGVFLSSGRRHTRSKRDWSSDVCSSDLLTELEISMFINEITESAVTGNIVSAFERTAEKIREYPHCDRLIYLAATVLNSSLALRSEERRVGKQRRAGWGRGPARR